MIEVREYDPGIDYLAVERLYKDGSTFGGQFDPARDTKERLDALIQEKPDSILVAVVNDTLMGTVTLFEDGRSAWLYRFAVEANEYKKQVTEALFAKAQETLKEQGHTQVLVYAPAGDTQFEQRYIEIGFTKGNDFTAYWQDL